MRALVATLLLAAACGETLTVKILPTTPELRASRPVPRLASKRVRVVNGIAVALAAHDVVAASRGAAAATAAEAELLAAGWQPVGNDDSAQWMGDDGGDDARLVIRSVTGGVDLAHPLDRCHTGPHLYGYWVDVDAALIDDEHEVQWSAHADARSTDGLELPVSATGDVWTSDLCERLLDPTQLTSALAGVACDDFTANRCDPAARLPTLVGIAVRRLVQDLVSRAQIAAP